MSSGAEAPNPSVAEDTTETYHLGMRHGYAQSEMADLQRQFIADTEDELSALQRIKMVLVSSGYDGPRDARIPEKAADLVPGRTRYFKVDPHDLMLGVLRGTDTIEELHISWLGLNKGFEMSLKYMEKYEIEYQTPYEELRPTSPQSTDPGIYEAYPSSKSAITRLTYLFNKVPHHQEQLPRDYDRDTGYLPHHLPPPDRLKEAFPDREPEERPPTVYYSSQGVRQERFVSARSSWRAGTDFQIPEEIVGKGKSKSVSIQEPAWKSANEERRERESGTEELALLDSVSLTL
ncbi:hypothetical protein B0H17DRAFT_1130466 [Mycena rosella]|uniref:Uncharacterized protein n=1 Tax=Mycena rosella TaxID=1033263 RepID=A0AAD7GP69_MYCRO|nr:hypothetical protein B0H17DRAFT_1130466 [Mycena rosella]